MDLNQKLLNAFQIEHVEHLEGIRSALARLESDDTDASVLEEAFRCAHSLKGAARVIGLSVVETLAHHLESFFARLRESSGTPDKELLSVVQLTLDAIEDAIAAFLRGQPVPTPSRALEEVTRLLNGEPTRPMGEPHISPLSPCGRGAGGEGFSATDSGGNAGGILTNSATGSGSQAAKPSAPLRLSDSVRLSAESLDRMLQSSAQLLTASMQQETMLRELDGLVGDFAALAKQWQAIKRDAFDARGDRTLQRAYRRQHIEHVDQQFHTIARRARGVLQLQRHTAWSNRQLADQLRSDVRRARMVPAESIFQGFRKMIRDLANDQNKEIDFRLSGMETEADWGVLQSIKDPLMHVLRNAVCHGIESAPQRSQAGKPARGEIWLKIEAGGSELKISVEDEGRGIDAGRVAQVAAKQGLVPKGSGPALNNAQLLDVLVRPGFSTCETVTELAGRGMGLAIVHEAVARLQGQLSIRARDGGGTCVVMTIPTTVSTHRILLAACGGQAFGFPLAEIESVMRIDRTAVENLEGRPILSVGGQLTPVASLSGLLQLAGTASAADNARLTLIMLKAGGRRLAVAVDALLCERDAVIQRIAPPANRCPLFSGGTIQENGSVCLVLDPAELFKRSTATTAADWSQAPVAANAKVPTILVVDDSITTRTLETTILQSHGYQVRVAINGIEALARLRAEPIDLVISDIQMPQLDGFGLLEAIKTDAKLSATPVIIVSSMENRQYQERGLRLGADAYIVKRNFDHQELLQTIEQIV